MDVVKRASQIMMPSDWRLLMHSEEPKGYGPTVATGEALGFCWKTEESLDG